MTDPTLSPSLFTPHADAIREVLRRHKVLMHYRATAEGRRTCYAVFSGGIQNGEPRTHADAQRRREALTMLDLLELEWADA